MSPPSRCSGRCGTAPTGRPGCSRQSESGGDGALQADHDLDALCALFAEAARAEEQHAHRSVIEIATALEAQQIPADTLAQQVAPSRAVQLMTAHRAKGLEWPLVVVAGVQDGEWPDARWRSSLLQVERLGPDGVREPPSARSMIAEERRLFYVACSRAQSRLVVTAVAAGADDGDQPSRFVGELHAHVSGQEGRTFPEPENRPRRALSLRGAVAELRRIGESTTSPAVRARAAAALAAVVDQQGGAHPDRWWGLRELSISDEPIRDPDEPLRLSGSAVSTMEECPLKWFLAREARGERGSSAAQGFGSIVHAIAAEVVRSGVDADPDQLAKHLDGIWSQLEHPAEWIGEREHEAAVDAIVRFSRWHREHGREVLAAEHEFEVAVDVDGRAVLMGGSMDRVELSGDGVHVVDLKTSKNPLQKKEIAEHPQLGFYQLAVEHGAAAGLPGVEACRRRRRRARAAAQRRGRRPRLPQGAGAGRPSSRTSRSSRSSSSGARSMPSTRRSSWPPPPPSPAGTASSSGSARPRTKAPRSSWRAGSDESRARRAAALRAARHRLHRRAARRHHRGPRRPRASSSPEPGRARPRSWRPAWSGWSATSRSRRSVCSA